ncbi:MAG: class C beta-lactamase-related serine hydrolase [Bacteroidetes bacterium]|nr:MAG: class C beta-lactamase-related serine hydrolase [Bacteroidota bacterium]TAG88298.1 MAG: class C beta-lactamase-related serine hydrolase [Bacteroidota bacterium]
MKKLKKISFYFLISCVVLLIFSYVLIGFTQYQYLQTAILYAYRGSSIASINDADKEILQKSSSAEKWKLDEKYNQHKLSEDDLKYIDKYKTVAFLVIQNDKIKFEKYWDNYNENSLSNSFSMAKSVISLAIGIAISEGKIKNVAQKISDFLPEFKKNGKENLTFKDFLTMSSGLQWSEEYKNPLSDVVRAYFEKDLYAQLTNLPIAAPAGKVFKYSSGDTEILGLALQKAVKMPLTQYINQKIWKKIGAERDAYWFVDKKGNQKSFCCLHSNAKDFARLAKLVLQNGKWNDEQIVPESYIKEAISPADYLNVSAEKDEKVKHYGYQFWLLKYKNTYYPCFRGVLGQFMIIIPEKNAIVVRLGHKRTDEMVNYMPKDIYVYLEMATKILD